MTWARGLEGSRLRLSIPLNPVPASRPRVSKWGTYYPKRYATWKKDALKHLPAKLEKGCEYFPKPMELSVSLEFIVQKPKTTKRTNPLGDVDNYTKAALDAVTSCGGVWGDDDQVTVTVAEKRFAEPGEKVQTIIRIINY